ncbi:hypothetical protein TeGR_g12505 [Tetraparma gracilis]|uniref:Uncharacterized protein n=1 Tax=Tetraparma gracilis TaxID=2962635 RepID=A0ABQ6MKZ8_9STRA|nr:hypothetical protein TeGR_g12505 [Tetraparma gracilis]
MTVPVAIPVIMGANIGTSVTNTLVSFGQVNDDDQFERAFAGATVHDMFNFLTVFTLLPIELIFHPLEHISNAMKPETVDDEDKWEGPIKKWVAPLVKRVLNANKDVIKYVAKGEATCAEIYADPEETGLIKCSNLLNPFTGVESAEKICPAFYKENATREEDMASGAVCLLLSILGLCICLYSLVKVLQSIVLSSSVGLIKRSTDVNPYFAMVVGCGVTILVQSSSITTSVLTPLVGLDIIKLEQMFPLTLGANIGTTGTAVMASMVSSKPEAVQIAICHLFFNIFGILIWFPVPFMRQWPIRAAKQLGFFTRKYKQFPIWYIMFSFVVAPAILMGVSTLFDKGGAFVVIGWLLVIAITGVVFRSIYWFKRQDGYSKLTVMLEAREARAQFTRGLHQHVIELESRIAALEAGPEGSRAIVANIGKTL